MDIDVNKPVENPELSALLKQLKDADEAKRNELREKIAEELAMKSHLLAIVRIDDQNVERKEDGTAVFKKDSKLSFVMLQDQGGRTYLPVYTDWTEIGKNEKFKDQPVNTFILSFDDMAAITAGKAGIAVNPYSDNFVITAENVVHMKQHKDSIVKGYSENVVKETMKVQIGEPADYPHEMVESIRKYAKTNKDIEAIWLKLMVKENEKSYLLIVDFKGDRNSVFSAIANAAIPHIHNGMPVDMVPLTDKFGRDAATGEPFYRRKKGLFW